MSEILDKLEMFVFFDLQHPETSTLSVIATYYKIFCHKKRKICV